MNELLEIWKYDPTMWQVKIMLYIVSLGMVCFLAYILFDIRKDKKRKKVLIKVEKKVSEAWSLMNKANSTIDISYAERKKMHASFEHKMKDAAFMAEDAGCHTEAMFILNNLSIQVQFNFVFVETFENIRKMHDDTA